MPTEITFVRTTYRDSLETPGAFSGFEVGDGDTVRLLDYGAGRYIEMTADGLQIRSTGDLSGWEGLTLQGSSAQVYAPAMAALIDAPGDSAALYLSPDAFSGVGACAVSDGDFVYLAPSHGQGIAGYTVSGDGLGSALGTTADTDEAYAARIADMAIYEGMLVTASATEHGISAYRIDSDGDLELQANLGMQQSVPMQGAAALATSGNGFLIAAAEGTGSLTVFSYDGGSLQVVDHVLDDQDTRFGGAAHLESFAYGGRSFVLAGGHDGGLSLFALTDLGRLVHLDSLEGRDGMALGDLASLTTRLEGEELQILTRSASQAGVSQFNVDLGATGETRVATSSAVSGSNRDDILSDHMGETTLTGGDGADIFQLRADGAADVIADFTLGSDQLDLSDWDMLRNLDQISLTPQSGGALLRYGGESLRLISHDGAGYDAEDLAVILPHLPTHIVVEAADLIVSPPAPDPDPITPPPTPTPDPAPGDTRQVLVGTDGNDTITGGGAGDRLDGGGGDDSLDGGAGADEILGRAGNDWLIGGPGDDTISASDGDDTVYGNGGNDSLGGGLGADRMYGGLGDDIIGASNGRDRIEAGDGDDIASGGWSHDTVFGGDGNDTLAGSYDADEVFGGSGADSMGGGTGNDTLYAGAGDDQMGAGEHNDLMFGEDGHDFLGGGAGRDTMDGGQGADTLNGGLGDDLLIGGAGADQFVFTAFTSGERDVIEDFTDGVDMIRMHDVGSGGKAARLAMLEASAQSGGVVLRYQGHEVFVQDMGLAELGVEDFIFL